MSKKKEKTKEQGPQPKLDKHYNIAETEGKMQDLWETEEHYKEARHRNADIPVATSP